MPRGNGAPVKAVPAPFGAAGCLSCPSGPARAVRTGARGAGGTGPGQERSMARERIRRVVDPQTGRVVTETATLHGEAAVAPGVRMVPGKKSDGGKKKNKKG
ncbi:hypothetical protein I3J09_07765 [Streptomyces clavuligerus]|uniref:Uncharacterized protein n=2 Tax=Streptomyces clavuligerus TaxID=1901 RepID=B5GL94_STRCL|nr:hypothetical protein BB341_07675 [Streptomyces clavuligerus]AXU12671.1 hypothetical protein D1794_07965 [Streptomyces clavuligerus]EDY47090.1 hypothetical protein SSCG_00118 [Streptomyces clavuligerus]EFG09301.1 Hypothetical protein SCLAV_4227 [Streptomyces clavuligerus]MBY6302574.1 hypothetical protein [Streptomyces clavuligerus]